MLGTTLGGLKLQMEGQGFYLKAKIRCEAHQISFSVSWEAVFGLQ